MSITVKELASTVAESAGITKVAAEKVLADLFGSIGNSLHGGEEVVIKDFGRLYVKVRPARAGRNPKTGEAINIPAKSVIKFTPRGALK